jgi:hypothetical protein
VCNNSCIARTVYPANWNAFTFNLRLGAIA